MTAGAILAPPPRALCKKVLALDAPRLTLGACRLLLGAFDLGCGTRMTAISQFSTPGAGAGGGHDRGGRRGTV